MSSLRDILEVALRNLEVLVPTARRGWIGSYARALIRELIP